MQREIGLLTFDVQRCELDQLEQLLVSVEAIAEQTRARRLTVADAPDQNLTAVAREPVQAAEQLVRQHAEAGREQGRRTARGKAVALGCARLRLDPGARGCDGFG